MSLTISASQAAIPPREAGSKLINVIVDTPKGSRNKLRFEAKLGLFSLGKVLPAGAVFPYDFGFIPGTCGDDGDPLDVLLLMDAPVFPGVRVQTRLIGVIEAEQTEHRTTERNDRLVAVAAEAHNHRNLKSLKQLESTLLRELEHFFISYNEMDGKKFKPLGCRGPRTAERLLKKGILRAKREK